MKHILTSITLAALAISAISCAGTDSDTLKVMSFNIRNSGAKDGENAWALRCAATPAMLDSIAPDVVGMQEVLPDQVEYINANCPAYASIGVGREDGVDQGEHMSIYYRKDRMKVLQWGTYWLSETPDVPSIGWDARCRRTATWAYMKMKNSGKRFYVVNTHLDHKGEEARMKGLALIIDKIGEMNHDDVPMILMGDFNVFPDDTCLVELDKIMKSARTFAAVSDTAPSFTDWGREPKIIDYIYYRGFEECKDFRVVSESFAGVPYISDHYPILSDFVF